MGKAVKGRGIILSIRSLGEADKGITILSPELGKASIVAKGAKRLTSRKRGSLEVFSNVRFQAAKGKSMHIFTDIEVINSYKVIRSNLKKVSVAYFFVDAASKLAREEESFELYDLLVSYLNDLGENVRLKSLRDSFTADALTVLGFWPKGRDMPSPDAVLESVVERKLGSVRVGRRITS